MRRKSARNAQKATPDKSAKESEPTPKTRRSRRRKRSPSKSSESEDEVLTVTKRAPLEETPDTTTKSHTPSDEEISEEPIWKVTSSEDSPQGEIQKLKICLTRPSPDSPEKTKSRRSKSNSQTEDDATSSEDKTSRRTRSQGSPFVRNDGISSQEVDEDVDDKKGKGKSKGKHKSKIEKSPHLSEPELQPNNEISENVQVTPQSPSIDKPVDNENDNVNDIQSVNESVQKSENTDEAIDNKVSQESMKVQNTDVESDTKIDNDAAAKESDDDDQPLSIIQKSSSDSNIAQETCEETISNKPLEDQPLFEDVSETVVLESVIEKQCETPSTEQNSKEETIERPTEEITKEAIEESNQVEASVETDDCIKKGVSTEEHEQIQTNSSDDNSTKKISATNETKSTEESSPLATAPEEPSKESSVPTAIESEDLGEEKVKDTCSTPPPPSKSLKNSSQLESIGKTRSKESKTLSASPERKRSRRSLQHVESVEKPADVKSSSGTSQENSSNKSKGATPRLILNRNIEPLTEAKDNSEENSETLPIKPSKIKRKWACESELSSLLVKVDLDSIQSAWPTIDFPEEPDLTMEIEKERRKSSDAKKLERKVSVEYKSDLTERPSYDKQSSVSSSKEAEDNSNIIAFNRKISIVDDTASKLRPPPSPSKNPVSNILYITNLVRPFTVKQLKELLERTGKIQEEGFWTDRIKSKCYVQYDTQEEAETTRNALHGVQWPIGNGKKLIIDFATEEDMQNAKNPPPPPPVAPPPEPKIAVKENLEPVENKSRSEEKGAKDLEKKRTDGPVREWDIGKKDLRRDRSRSRERSRKHRRSPSPTDDFISRKQRKTEESVPQKLMDDLFLKTKATPSIYWQPLSPEEISMKQQQRLIRMEEHKRRMEENSRMKGRDPGRGAFRRRYD